MFTPRFSEINKIYTSPWMFLLSVCYGYKKFIFFEFFYTIFFNFFKIAISLVFAYLVDYFSNTPVEDFVWSKGLFIIGALFVVMLFVNINRYIREIIGEGFRNTICWRAMEYAIIYASGHSSQYLKEQKSGSLAQRIIKLGDACWFQLMSLTRINSCFWQMVIPLYFIGRANLCFLALSLGFGICSMLLSFFSSKHITKLEKESSAIYSSFLGEVADALSNILLIKSFGAEKKETQKIKEDLVNVAKIQIRKEKQRALVRSGQALWIAFFRICGLFTALKLLYNGDVDIANTVMVLLLFDDVSVIFQRFLYDVTNTRNAMGTMDDALQFLKVKHEIIDNPNAKELIVRKGKIEFKNISFGYKDATNKIFKNFNLTLNPGERLGIVGKTGSGKSTLINLLQRVYDVDNGEILIDGQNIKNVKLSDIRKAIAIVSQETLLFYRSIRQNIAYGHDEFNERDIRLAAKKSCADDFIKNQLYGYLTLTGERGVKLSGGERQRIAIARTFLKKSPILILDEATSALDNITESEVSTAINTLMKGKTVIAIAHRLSTLKEMDRIIVIDSGKIIEEGTPDKLLDKKGKFAKLWNLQKG